MTVARIDHVAVMVRDLREALALFHAVLGGRFIVGGDDTERGIRTLQLGYPGGMKIELVMPVREDSYLHDLMDRRGQGFHHMAILVDDISAVLAQLEREGIDVTGTDLSVPAWQETYIRPVAGFGTLLQLAQSDRRWDEPLDGITLDMVLEGNVLWAEDGMPRLKRSVGALETE